MDDSAVPAAAAVGTRRFDAGFFGAVGLVDRDGRNPRAARTFRGLPLAITLLAQMAQVDPLAELLRRWREEATSMLTRIRGSRLSCLDTSISLSLNSDRVKNAPETLRLLSVLSVLPAGLPPHFQHPAISMLGKSTAVLKASALAYSAEGGRLRVLSPIREYILKYHPPAMKLIAPLTELCAKVAILCEQIGSRETAHLLRQVADEATNVESLCYYMLQHALDAD